MSAKIKSSTLYVIGNLTSNGFGNIWELAILLIRMTKRILRVVVFKNHETTQNKNDTQDLALNLLLSHQVFWNIPSS